MALTTNFGIELLNGSDTAGYSSINTVIQSVDTVLNTKINTVGMIMAFDSTYSVPVNWSTLTPTLGLPTLTLPYIWIKKVA